MKKKKETKPNSNGVLSDEQVEKVSKQIYELIICMNDNGFTRRQCMKMLAFTVVDALQPPTQLRDEFCVEFVKMMKAAFEIEDQTECNKELAKNVHGMDNIDCDETGATIKPIRDVPQESQSFEDMDRKEKMALCAKFMNSMIPQFREAFTKWFIPRDMQVDVFCVMLVEILPMYQVNYELMGEYVKKSLILAYKYSQEVEEKKNEDGEEN